MKDRADRRLVLWCAVNLRPAAIRHDVGFQLLAETFCPSYVETTMSNKTFDTKLDSIYMEVVGYMMDDIRLYRQSCLDLGYDRAFLGGQLDLTTVANEEYITFCLSYVPPKSAEITRVGIATRAFPGSHTATDIASWIEEVSCRVSNARVR